MCTAHTQRYTSHRLVVIKKNKIPVEMVTEVKHPYKVKCLVHVRLFVMSTGTAISSSIHVRLDQSILQDYPLTFHLKLVITQYDWAACGDN